MAKAPKQMVPKFKVGDLVVLKSNGPTMTIEKVAVNINTQEFVGTYRCQWFAGKKLDTGSFPEDSLEAYTPKQQTQTNQP